MSLLSASLDDWHKRFAHTGIDSIKEMLKNNAVTGLEVSNSHKIRCEHCALGKICRCPHPSRSQIQATADQAVLHLDTCGPISVKSLGGSKYFFLATEEYSGYKLIAFTAEKSDGKDIVKEIINRVELEAKRPVKMILTDGGGEYYHGYLTEWLKSKGIIHDVSTRYTPQQNGRAEGANRTIIEGTRIF